jgi:uncharacterized membrane protein
MSWQWLMQFIEKYYIDPIVMDSGYNPINTVTWALLLGVFLWLAQKAFVRYDIRIDHRFILSTIPYIVAGASLRVVEDAELLSAPAKYMLITPIIYFLVAAVALFALMFSRHIFSRSGGKRYLIPYSIFGIVWSCLNLVLLFHAGAQRPWVILLVASAGTLAMAGIMLFSSHLPFLQDRLKLLVLYSHMLDASSTYIGVDFLGYIEKHVVPTFVIERLGSGIVMYPLKLLVLIPVLFLMDESMEKDDLQGIVLLCLLVLGLAPAIRNTLRMALGI